MNRPSRPGNRFQDPELDDIATDCLVLGDPACAGWSTDANVFRPLTPQADTQALINAIQLLRETVADALLTIVCKVDVLQCRIDDLDTEHEAPK